MDTFNDLSSIEMRLVEKATHSRIPLKATFEITPFCNFKCNMCYVRQSQKKIEANGGLLDKDFWLKTAEELQNLGCLFILITGGEPLTHPDFKEIYIGLKKKGFIVTINTNGSLINDEIIHLFKADPPRRINVTLYGASNQTYHKLCYRKNGFDETYHSLKLIKRNNIDCKINATIVKENIEDFTDIIKIAKQLELPLEATSYLFPAQRKGNEHIDILSSRVTPQDAADLELEIMRQNSGKTEKDYYLDRKRCFMSNKKVINNICLDCRAGKSACWINWKGELTPCVFLEEPSINIKSQYVQTAWKEIVCETEKMPTIPQCEGCQISTLCNICYAGAKHELRATGTLDYLCKMAQEKLRLITTH